MLAKRIFFIVLILAIILPNTVSAAGAFNKNFIVSDDEFFDSEGMTLSEVQKFLESHNSALASYVATDVDGALRTAAEIIWRTATTFNVNPKFFLVLLQKEQSLVETQHLTQYQLDWATGFSRCDTCSQDHPALQDNKGLAAQLYYAGQHIHDKYLPDIQASGKTSAGFGPGVVKRVDGYKVVPANKATAILYTYTPHIAGNKHFWQIWDRWFAPLYPDGTLLQDKKSGGIWLIASGYRRPFLSKAAFYSRYDADQVIQVDAADLDRYEIGPSIKFADYSLLQLPDDKIYLIAGNQRREITSREVMRTLGFMPDELISAVPDDIAAYEEGDPITVKTVYPLGALLQDIKTGGVYFVIDGQRRPILAKQLLSLYFKGRKIIKANAAQLAKFAVGEPIAFKDGEIVGLKKTGQIYIISNGQRRPITKEVLQSLGFDSSRIVWTTEKMLALQPIGDVILYTTTSPDALAAINISTASGTIEDPNLNDNQNYAAMAATDTPIMETDINEALSVSNP